MLRERDERAVRPVFAGGGSVFVFRTDGPEAWILNADPGTGMGYGRRKPQVSYDFDELVKLEKKTRKQARLGLIAGGIVTGAAVVLNAIAVSEYHKNDTWSELDGTVGFAISHLGFAPVGTGLLIWGFKKRGKANAIQSSIGGH